MKLLKHFAFSLAGILFLSAPLYAQENGDEEDDGPTKFRKADTGDISIGFHPSLNLLNLGAGGLLTGGATGNQFENDLFGNAQILGRYYVKKNISIRLGLGIHSNRRRTTNKDSTRMWSETGFEDANGDPVTVRSDSAGFTKTKVSESQFNFSITPGVEYHISTNSNVDPYVGLDIPLAFLGSTTLDSTTERSGYYFDVTDNEYRESSYESNWTEKSPGGFGFGMRAIVGFNYFISDKISIGAEYRLGFMNTMTGGKYTGSEDRTGTKDGIEYTDKGNEAWSHDGAGGWGYQEENSQGGFSTSARGGFNLSIFF